MVPDGWKILPLGEVCTFLDGQRKPIKSEDRAKISGIYPYYGATGVIDWVNDFIFDDEIILMGEDGENILSRSLPHVFKVVGKSWVNNHAHVLKPQPFMDIDFLVAYLESLNYVPYNTGSAQPKLNKAVCESIKVIVPPLKEQIKIGEMLSTWDKSIEATERLLENSKKRKKALMQQLLTGKKRLHGFDTRWKYQPISTIVTRVQRKAEDRDSVDLPILTISSSTGFVLQSDKYSKYMAGESVKNYTRLKKGEFSYNKGSSKAYVFGCIFELENWEEALVPNVYVSFRFFDDIDRGFFRHLFAMGYLDRQLGRLVNSGVRNDGLLNITPSEFLKVSVPLPPYDEQVAISKILDVSSYEIKLFQQSLDDLKKEKKALMQQLLTGKKRVKVEEAA